MSKAELVHSIKRLSVLMNRRIDDVLKAHGMARSQFQVLYLINKSGRLTQKQLLESLEVEPATLSGLIDTLESKDLVKRSVVVDDKRSKSLELTKSGQNIIAKIPHPGVIVEANMFRGVSTSDKNTFQLICSQLIRNLEANDLTK
ncbi:MAG: MarR family winged helix-turn-helix transcriptional regulator [Candidatus Saccharimonadales bacterium]